MDTDRLDLAIIRARVVAAAAFSRYHAEHARYGGVSGEFHARAQTWIEQVTADLPALVAEVEALRGELERLVRERDEARALKVPATTDEVLVAQMNAAVARTAAKRWARAYVGATLHSLASSGGTAFHEDLVRRLHVIAKGEQTLEDAMADAGITGPDDLVGWEEW